MKKIILFAGLFCIASATTIIHAQSIDNKNWKAYFDDPINDTLTLHLRGDSSYATSSNGNVMVQTKCTISRDTLTLADYGGEHACLDTIGKYKINLEGDILTLTLIDDPCDGRGEVLNGRKWTESK